MIKFNKKIPKLKTGENQLPDNEALRHHFRHIVSRYGKDTPKDINASMRLATKSALDYLGIKEREKREKIHKIVTDYFVEGAKAHINRKPEKIIDDLYQTGKEKITEELGKENARFFFEIHRRLIFAHYKMTGI